MKAKINNFLQSDIFILSVALLMGFLCHLFVNTEILTSDKYTNYSSNFSRSLSIPHSVDQKKAEMIKANGEKAKKMTIKFLNLKFTNS